MGIIKLFSVHVGTSSVKLNTKKLKWQNWDQKKDQSLLVCIPMRKQDMLLKHAQNMDGTTSLDLNQTNQKTFQI
ncbi:MAG: hypothetical protein N838_29565 [Thiohalocapsa sp. PB-PSB1]|nr:MAG: hypothetical protein N838_29565 [Thiohalocapsa sp. PB-PSB1]